MIPFLIAGGALLTWGMHGANKETKEEISEINNDMEDMLERTKSMITSTKRRHTAAVNKLNKQKVTLYETTMENFTECAQKIKNIDFGTVSKMSALKGADGGNLQFSTVHYSGGAPEVISTIAGGLFIGELVKGLKLDEKLEEAKAERSKLKAQCAAAKGQCTKMNSVTKLCKTAYETIKALKEIADNAIDEMRETVDEYGTDYMMYPEKAQEQIWFTFTVIDALNKISNKEIIKNGNLNKEFEQFIGEVKTQYLEEAY